MNKIREKELKEERAFLNKQIKELREERVKIGNEQRKYSVRVNRIREILRGDIKDE